MLWPTLIATALAAAAAPQTAVVEKKYPDGVVRLTLKLENVEPAVKQEFCTLALAVNEKLTLAKRVYQQQQQVNITPVVNTAAPVKQQAAPRRTQPVSGVRR